MNQHLDSLAFLPGWAVLPARDQGEKEHNRDSQKPLVRYPIPNYFF